MNRRKAYFVQIEDKYLKKVLSKYPSDKKNILNALDEMTYYPPFPGIRPITGHRGMYRKKMGDLRILYIMKKKQMYIFRIAHRKECYRGL